jgi:hypothetical protein
MTLAASAYDAPAMTVEFLQVGFYLLAGAASVMVIYRQARPSSVPQPLQTTRAPRMATFDELAQLRREFEVFREEQRESNRHLLEEGQKRADMLRTEITRSTGNLHSRVDDVLRAVSRLEGKIES